MAGLAIPCALDGLFYSKILPLDLLPVWLLLVLWPAFGFYMASNAPVVGFAVSALANGVIYLLAGVFFSHLHRLLFVKMREQKAK
jgi:hypothetical protein